MTQMTQITQIHTKKTICVNLRDLRGIVLGFEGGHVLIGRYGLPFGGIQHPASSIQHPASTSPKPQASSHKKNTPPFPAGCQVVDVE